MGGDLSSIESRVLASPLVADEKWKTDAYLLFDATQDPRHEPSARPHVGLSANRPAPSRRTRPNARLVRPQIWLLDIKVA